MEYLGGGSALDLVSLCQNNINEQFDLNSIMIVPKMSQVCKVFAIIQSDLYPVMYLFF